MNGLGSLRGRLSVALLLTLGGLWAGVLANARHRAADGAVVEADARLEATAARLFQVVILAGRDERPDGDGPVRPLPVPGAPDGARRTGRSRLPGFEIVWEDGRPSLVSSDFPHDVGPTGPGIEERAVGARTYRVLTVVYRTEGAVGRVALDDVAIAALAGERHRDVVWPLLWVFPLLAVAALASVAFGLAPLGRLERSLAAQDPLDLGLHDIEPRRMPRELGALATVVRRLLTRLRDVLERQRAFTSAAAHELRTPLAGCRIQVQVAERSPDGAARERALDLARHSLDRMDRLVDQMLALARVDVGIDEVPMRRVDVVALVASVLTDRERSAAAAGVALRRSGSSPDAFVLGNAPLLESLVGNLVDNAIGFSPPRSTVDVSVDERRARVEIRVLDRGPGMTVEERERAFDAFHRGEGIRREGSGLGLTTVRAIARAHGGDARLDAPPAGGTEAVVTLPAATAPTPSPDAASGDIGP